MYNPTCRLQEINYYYFIQIYGDFDAFQEMVYLPCSIAVHSKYVVADSSPRPVIVNLYPP